MSLANGEPFRFGVRLLSDRSKEDEPSGSISVVAWRGAVTAGLDGYTAAWRGGGCGADDG